MFGRCKHTRILIHSVGIRYNKTSAAFGVCKRCGKTQQFELGVVSEEAEDKVVQAVLEGLGYALSDEPNEWVKV